MGLHATNVHKLQNLVAKVTDGKVRKYENVTPILYQLQWIIMKGKITYDTGVAIFKYINNFYS